MKITDTILNKYLAQFIIGLFQFLGTTLFAYININLINARGNTNNQVSKIFYFFVDFSLSMFLCISYGRQMSGGVHNPANSLFRIFRRTDRYPLKTGLLYITAQMAGGVAGSFLALWINDVKHAPITSLLPGDVQAQYFITEVLGTFILTFMVQYSVQKKMTFIEHNRQFYVYLPMMFMISRVYSNKSNGVNPAFGLGFELVYCAQSGNWDVMKMSYILIFGPWVGALLSVFVFELGFRPLFPVKPTEAAIKTQGVIQRRPTDHQLGKVNRRWDLKQVLTMQALPALGDQYQFTLIKEGDYDDQIKSLSDGGQNKDEWW